ncbi:MAG: aldehyde dehydrogenase [Alicyclobacillus sp.]|nr:aldehyde dehydrogenase [Alicyclobacillus sp.]
MNEALAKRYHHFIGGEFRPPVKGGYFPVVNPSTEETVTEVADGTQGDIDAAVAAAQAAFTSGVWSQAEGRERAAVLQKLADNIRAHMDHLVFLETLCTGRPLREMKAQLSRLPEWFEYFAALAQTVEGSVPQFAGDYLNYTLRVPLGVVGLLTPWNHPLLILAKKLAPALAAGNCVVVKPSEFTPISTLVLAELATQSGLPPGVMNVVTGFGATAGQALSAHPGLSKVDVTGGTETGRKVASAAGANLASVACELGGKASLLFFADCDIDQAVNGAAFAAYIASGQTCVQGARLLVQRSLHDEFVERLVRKTQAIRIGDPFAWTTQMGPLVSKRQLDRTESYVRIALEEGASLACGGARPEGFARGYYYLPTVFTGVSNEMRIAQEEVFGPVTCVLPFDSEEEAICLANGTEYGLAMGVWTRDVKRAHRVVQKLESGIVWVNDHHRLAPASPWGGWKASGIGRENGIDCYLSYTKVKSVIVGYADEPFDWFTDAPELPRYS